MDRLFVEQHVGRVLTGHGVTGRRSQVRERYVRARPTAKGVEGTAP
jgi:hypothetical protein